MLPLLLTSSTTEQIDSDGEYGSRMLHVFIIYVYIMDRPIRTVGYKLLTVSFRWKSVRLNGWMMLDTMIARAESRPSARGHVRL